MYVHVRKVSGSLTCVLGLLECRVKFFVAHKLRLGLSMVLPSCLWWARCSDDKPGQSDKLTIIEVSLKVCGDYIQVSEHLILVAVSLGNDF